MVPPTREPSSNLNSFGPLPVSVAFLVKVVQVMHPCPVHQLPSKYAYLPSRLLPHKLVLAAAEQRQSSQPLRSLLNKKRRVNSKKPWRKLENSVKY